MPSWVLPDEFTDVFNIDDPEQIESCDAFFSEINPNGKEWRDAYKLGREFRKFMDRVDFPASSWTERSSAVWMQDRFDWACNHPGVGFPMLKNLFIDWDWCC